ncbi:MAG TPA: hypothetical protein P5102_02865 [Candidatus Competibacteraceae bacterium]|nr:hypothetical protein [Candidatus Competibacteraceae bacterium]HRZ05087.1 hypothetical protein [Candidatus Competibacteraceae bacterium]HSA48119.1 hypothetical protein [Candidatus Competibacteraceae bacterium]
MTQDEFLAEASRRFGYQQKPKAAIADPLDDLSPADIDDLLPDLLKALTGQRRALRAEHPAVVSVLRENLSLDGLRTRAGMTISDFGNSLAAGLSELVVSKFASQNTDIEKVTAPVDLSDFRANALSSLSMPEVSESFEGIAYETLKFTISEAPKAGRLRTFGGAVRFSRAIWSSLGEALAIQIPVYAAAVFSSIEARLLAELLEAGTITQSTNGSIYGGLPEAAKTMRDQLNPAGAKANHPIYGVIIPPALEMAFKAYKVALGWSDLVICINAFLTSDTTWYAVANPAIAPAILRLRLRGAGRPSVYSNSDEYEVMRFAVSHDVNFALSATNPTGLIKCVAG